MASEEVFLPCEFCHKMIVLINVYTHQAECQTKNDPLSKCDGKNNNILLPCEFCEIPIDFNNLMCHQIICRKNLKKIKKSASYTAEKTKSSLNSKNMMLINETFSFQDQFNQNLSNIPKTKNSVQKSSCNLDLNLPSTSQNYVVPTLVLRKLKITDNHSNNSLLSLNPSILPIKCNSNTNSMHVANVKNKMGIKYNDKSPFISLYGRNVQNDSTCINISYSEHNLPCIMCRLYYIEKF